MTAVSSAVMGVRGIRGGLTITTGTIAISITVLITAVSLTVMRMVPFFCTIFNGTDRTLCRNGDSGCLASAMMPMRRNRHYDKACYKQACRYCAEHFFDIHDIDPLSYKISILREMEESKEGDVENGYKSPANSWAAHRMVPLEARFRSAKTSSGTKFKSRRASFSLSTDGFQGPPQEPCDAPPGCWPDFYMVMDIESA